MFQQQDVALIRVENIDTWTKTACCWDLIYIWPSAFSVVNRKNSCDNKTNNHAVPSAPAGKSAAAALTSSPGDSTDMDCSSAHLEELIKEVKQVCFSFFHPFLPFLSLSIFLTDFTHSVFLFSCFNVCQVFPTFLSLYLPLPTILPLLFLKQLLYVWLLMYGY